MSRVAAREPMGQKDYPEQPDPRRIRQVRALPCCICWEWNMQQLSRTQAHHCIHDRNSQKRSPDSMAIPLCEGHHQGLFDGSKLALHQASEQWRAEYGRDKDWIEWTNERINT